MGKDTAKDWLEKAKAVANNGEYSDRKGTDNTKPLIFSHGNEWEIKSVVFSNKFDENNKLKRIKVVVENITTKEFIPTELTFLNRPICVGDKTYIRDARCYFTAVMNECKGLSDKATCDLIETRLKGKSGVIEEQIHANGNSYRTEKKFILK
jgi:hypothetical protein